MSTKRRRFNSEFKFRVALEAAKGQQTVAELASKHNLHPNQISQWKRQLLDSGAEVFSHNGNKEALGQDAQQSELYEQIGRHKMELEWLKKKAAPFT